MDTSSSALLDLSGNVDKSKKSKRKKNNNKQPKNVNGIAPPERPMPVPTLRKLPVQKKSVVPPPLIPPLIPPKSKHLDYVIDQIRRGHKVLVFLRGLPGSGKSFLARRIVEIALGTQRLQDFIFSADDFFIRNGR